MSKGLEALNRVKQIEITETVLCGDGKIKQLFIEAQNHEDYKEDLSIIEEELKDFEWLKSTLSLDWFNNLPSDDKLRFLKIMGVKYE